MVDEIKIHSIHVCKFQRIKINFKENVLQEPDRCPLGVGKVGMIPTSKASRTS